MSVTLFTIHGINAGPWQEELAPYLSPHFSNYEALEYDGYSGLFSIRGPANLAYGRRLNKTAEIIDRQIHEKRKGSIRSYIIAHSFGTVIVASILDRFPGKKFDRILFLGSALRRDFNWGAPHLREQGFSLHNMHGRKDQAVPWAGVVNRASRWPLLGRLFCNFVGDAGRAGFIGPFNIVHNIVTPLSGCDSCDGKAHNDRTPVHNIALGVRHSDYFLNPDTVHELLIPYIFGMSPIRYERFISLCREAREYCREHGPHALNPCDAKLLDLDIEYEDGTLKTVRQQLHALLDELLWSYGIPASATRRESAIPLLIQGVWTAVSEACEDKKDPRKAVALLPRKAMERAVKSLMKPSYWADDGAAG